MQANLKAELAKIAQQPLRQDSELEQLRDLRAFANKLGLYDASDLIRRLTRELPSNSQPAGTPVPRKP